MRKEKGTHNGSIDLIVYTGRVIWPRTAVFISISSVLLLACSGGHIAPSPVIEVQPQEEKRWTIDQAMAQAAGYLVRHLDKDGRFDYLRRSSIRESKYNLLRHAGAIYSLQQYYARHPSPQILSAIQRSSQYLKTRYLRPLHTQPAQRAAISLPSEENLDGPTAKLGGTALALVALCGMHTLDPTFIDKSELQAMGRFILFMQKPDGSFHSKYREDAGFDLRFHSLFYPGEAMLALTMLYEIDRDLKWLQASANAAAQLVKSRRGLQKIPSDHWMMLASVPLLQFLPDLEVPPLSPQALLTHVERIAGLIVKKQRTQLPAHSAIEHGSFDKGARSTPTATRLEGLGALVQTLSNKDRVDTAVQNAIEAGVIMLRRCQLKQEGPEKGGMPRSCSARAGQGKRDREVRIDYVQHYLSALLSYKANQKL